MRFKCKICGYKTFTRRRLNRHQRNCVNWEAMNVAELREKAKEKGVTAHGKSKQELIDALRGD